MLGLKYLVVCGTLKAGPCSGCLDPYPLYQRMVRYASVLKSRFVMADIRIVLPIFVLRRLFISNASSVDLCRTVINERNY